MSDFENSDNFEEQIFSKVLLVFGIFLVNHEVLYNHNFPQNLNLKC